MRLHPTARALCLAGVFFPAVAQAELRTLTGLVVDLAGDPVPRAVVELACPPEGPARTLVADELGRLLAPLPQAGACRLTAHPPGGGPPEATLDLRADDSGSVTLTLDLDLFADRIEVRESAGRDALGSREIRESFARDAGAALALLPGFEKLSKGGIANDIVLRGQKGENLAVRIDGHALHGACPNRMDPPAFHIDFAEIERIVVHRGPNDASTGGLAGSIDILSRKPEPGLHTDLLAAAGAFGYTAPSATVTWADERWSLKGGLASRRGDAYEDGDGRAFTELLPLTAAAGYRLAARDDRAFDIATGWAGLGWIPRHGERLEIEATRQEADTQLYPYLQMDATRDDATRARASYRAEGAGERVESLALSLGWSRVVHDMDDHLRVSSSAAPRAYSMVTEALSEDWSVRGEMALAGGLRLGVEGQRRQWESETRLAGMAYRAQASLPGTSQDGTALFAVLDRPLGERLSLTTGARVERVSAAADPALADTSLYFAYHRTRSTSADDTLLSANAGLNWKPRDPWEITVQLGSAERAPDPQERYFSLRRMGTDWVGNPDLAAPRQSQLDLGASYRGERFTLEVSGWAARIDDAVTVVDGTRLVMVPGIMNQHARTYVNHDTRMWGAEVAALAPLGRHVALYATVAWVRGARDLAREIGIIDRDLPEQPPFSGRLSLRWEPGRWYAEVEGVAAAEQQRVDSGLQETPTPGWAIANLRGGIELGRFWLIGGLDNLFDRTYREHLSYQRDPFRAGVAVPEPGRSFSLTLRYRT
ncbi:MAG: TonB-dependent receptor [Thermoanaerobaculia bacterium]